MKKFILILFIPLLTVTLNSCKKDRPHTGVFLFSIQNDIDLGAKIDEEIKTSGEFDILDSATHVTEYAYLNAMKDEILAGDEIYYADEFVWDLNIIDDDSTLNAFCTPGGYIYVYSGLIKYLDNSSSLAGVLGHEMAHADRRHSSKQMQQQYGISLLVQIISGNSDPGLLTQVAASLTSLAFSRKDESEADEYSVKYLCPTDFDAAGAANFFQKIIDQGSPTPPEFLSTHPSPDNRVQHIHEEADAMDCAPDYEDPLINGISYAQFRGMF